MIQCRIASDNIQFSVNLDPSLNLKILWRERFRYQSLRNHTDEKLDKHFYFLKFLSYLGWRGCQQSLPFFSPVQPTPVSCQYSRYSACSPLFNTLLKYRNWYTYRLTRNNINNLRECRWLFTFAGNSFGQPIQVGLVATCRKTELLLWRIYFIKKKSQRKYSNVVAHHLFLLCFPPRPSRDLLFPTHVVHM